MSLLKAQEYDTVRNNSMKQESNFGASMGETQNLGRGRKQKEFQIIRNFNGNLSAQSYLEKIIKAHMEEYKGNVQKEEMKNG